MNKNTFSLSVLALLLVFSFVIVSRAGAAVKAFPSAEGFGANAVGGRGGRVIHVTNLNDSGPGSFRDAVTQAGPRIVVFDVSGTIQLTSNIKVLNPYITIAGQTSPGGVQIKTTPGVPTGIHFYSPASEIIVRHLRVRMGGPNRDDAGEPLIVNGYPTPLINAIFDHISLEWGTDSQFMAYNDFDKVTLQWSIIAEGASNTDFPNGSGKGSHYGGWGDSVNRMRFTDHHNLYASNLQRSPLIQHAGLFDLRNDLIYNWSGGNAAKIGNFGNSHSATGNVVNNHYLKGPSSSAPSFLLENGGPTRLDGTSAERGGTKVYTSGNWGPYCPGGCADDWVEFYTADDYLFYGTLPPASASRFRSLTPFAVPAVVTDPTSQVKNKVLANAGANKPSRDSLDTRIVDDVINGTGCLTCIGTGGPWPVLTGGAPPTDTDRDGMPDAWELSHGLNPNSAVDGGLASSNGYTNVENYLNELAGDSISGGTTPPPPSSTCSNLQNSTTAVPTNFGASFNWFTNAKELLMNVVCSGNADSATSATANIGNGSNTQYIYKTGYIWQNGTWSSFNYSGSSMDSGGNWFIGSANHSLGTLDLTQKQSVLAYICEWTPPTTGQASGKWNCGCHDSSCTTGYWNLQQFKQ